MKTITVNKADLLNTLQENRDAHRDIFEKALEVYRDRVIEAFETRLAGIKRGDKINTYINLPEPEDHTEDFNVAIKMLQWELGDKVELSMGEFQTYVNNEWGWQRSFSANTEAYAAAYTGPA